MKSIAVIGSINMDVVISADRFPQKGETIVGKNFFTTPGGKGANQAIAAAKCGANVTFYGCVGNDDYGTKLIEHFKHHHINSRFVRKISSINTGVAFITISENDNHIIIDRGANDYTNEDYVQAHYTDLLKHDIYLLQLEIPHSTVLELINVLHANGKTVVLDPAPAIVLPQEVIKKVDFLLPNEHEYKLVFHTERMMEDLLRDYPNKLIITEGKNGIRYFDGKELIHVEGLQVNAIDTTGAGDTFAGVFTTSLANGESIYDAIKLANYAAALSTTKNGAQNGMPTLQELNDFVDRL